MNNVKTAVALNGASTILLTDVCGYHVVLTGQVLGRFPIFRKKFQCDSLGAVNEKLNLVAVGTYCTGLRLYTLNSARCLGEVLQPGIRSAGILEDRRMLCVVGESGPQSYRLDDLSPVRNELTRYHSIYFRRDMIFGVNKDVCEVLVKNQFVELSGKFPSIRQFEVFDQYIFVSRPGRNTLNVFSNVDGREVETLFAHRADSIYGICRGVECINVLCHVPDSGLTLLSYDSQLALVNIRFITADDISPGWHFSMDGGYVYSLRGTVYNVERSLLDRSFEWNLEER